MSLFLLIATLLLHTSIVSALTLSSSYSAEGFDPSTLNAQVGDTIAITNTSANTINLTSPDQSIQGSLNPGQSYSSIIINPGTYMIYPLEASSNRLYVIAQASRKNKTATTSSQLETNPSTTSSASPSSQLSPPIVQISEYKQPNSIVSRPNILLVTAITLSIIFILCMIILLISRRRQHSSPKPIPKTPPLTSTDTPTTSLDETELLKVAESLDDWMHQATSKYPHPQRSTKRRRS